VRRPEGDVIYQPVLQYGSNYAFGGEYWRLATWICAPSSCYYSTPIAASTGNTIFGQVAFVPCEAGCYTSVTAINNSTSARTYMFGSAYADPDDMVSAAVTVETYLATACSDLPASGVFYTSLVLKKASGTLISPSWFAVSHEPSVIPSCAMGASWTSNTVSLLHNY